MWKCQRISPRKSSARRKEKSRVRVRFTKVQETGKHGEGKI
jgi:hypothetical protein